MRLVFRILAIMALSSSVVLAIIDVARSIGFSTFMTTSLLQHWQTVYPGGLLSFAHFVRTTFSEHVWENWLEPLLMLPGWLLFLSLAFLFYICSYRRKAQAA